MNPIKWLLHRAQKALPPLPEVSTHAVAARQVERAIDERKHRELARDLQETLARVRQVSDEYYVSVNLVPKDGN